MENGVEALKIASGMLIFVLTITIAISAFTTSAQALNRIFAMRDSEEYVTVTDENGEEYYLNFIRFDELEGGTRKVGVETIIPTIYRAYKENYAIYFYNSDGTELIIDEDTEVNYIDLQQEVHASAEDAINHINKILYEDGLYQDLKDETFIEKLGEYYMDDASGETTTAEVNKTKKRVITYTKVD